MYIDPLCDLEMRAVDRDPFNIESEIVRKVDTEVGLSSYTVESVFEFQFVNVDGYTGVTEEL